jgi:hypothetical protein
MVFFRQKVHIPTFLLLKYYAANNYKSIHFIEWVPVRMFESPASQSWLPDFSLCNIPKRVNIYQMATNSTK